MSEYLLNHGTRETPQSEPMRSDQVENSAGGFTWAVDEWTRLRRFLILGSEGGSYYASERKLTTENVAAVKACIALDGLRTVAEIVSVSEAGRAPKNDPALFALAAAISFGDKATKSAAAESLPRVARIGTHLYHFVAYAETMRGWGRTMRWAVQNWYDKNPDQLALQAVKYRQRDGWSHRDLLRLAHPKNDELAGIFEWIVRGHERHGDLVKLPAIIEGFAKAQLAASPASTARLVREYGLPREALLSDHLTDRDVWAALLEAGMPMTALIRNLATMTRIGVLGSRENLALVTGALGDEDAIRKSRVHPMTLLVALRTYASGHGLRGQNVWVPKPDVIDALDEAFYLAFGNVEASGKSLLLALDVSGSMSGGSVAGSPLTPREASAAMALVTLHAEPDVEIVGFSHTLIPLGLSRRQRLDSAVRAISGIPFGGTDCALPMLYAIECEADVDAFVVYTDSETWAGNIHPKQALDKYRGRSGIAARSAVVGMVSNGFTIADPNDAGMLDLVGFDTATPELLSGFMRGDF